MFDSILLVVDGSLLIACRRDFSTAPEMREKRNRIAVTKPACFLSTQIGSRVFEAIKLSFFFSVQLSPLPCYGVNSVVTPDYRYSIAIGLSQSTAREDIALVSRSIPSWYIQAPLSIMPSVFSDIEWLSYRPEKRDTEAVTPLQGFGCFSQSYCM